MDTSKRNKRGLAVRRTEGEGGRVRGLGREGRGRALRWRAHNRRETQRQRQGTTQATLQRPWASLDLIHRDPRRSFSVPHDPLYAATPDDQLCAVSMSVPAQLNTAEGQDAPNGRFSSTK